MNHTPKIRLRVNFLETLQKQNKWNDSELARKMGISRSRLWRAKLPEDHNEYCSPGEGLIAGALNAFPNCKFDDLFFLDKVCSGIHNTKE
jgi:transcriptional regulator with XRE-family HTH domain